MAATPFLSGVSTFCVCAGAIDPLDRGVVRADALDEHFGQDDFGGHFEQLALQRRTADVGDENLHRWVLDMF